MKFSIIWIDREHARIFHFSEESMERKRIRTGHTDHHTHRKEGIAAQKDEKALFIEAKDELASSDRVLIVGPSMAKHHFQTFLMEHYPALAKKVVGLETVDHPSDGQIAAIAKTYIELAS
ncbi:MAG: eRF1 domain 2 [Bdellovibrionota bacterium]